MIYKLLSHNKHMKKSEVIDEFRAGIIRFGWSNPNINLLDLLKTKFADMNDEELACYQKTQFLKTRLRSNDILFVQIEPASKLFLVAKIIEKSGETITFDGEKEDFNLVINCEPICNNEISIFSSIFSNSLRHNLMNIRGRYHAIYDQSLIFEIMDFIENRRWEEADYKEKSYIESELLKTKNKLIRNAVKIIQNDWKAKDFELLVSDVFSSFDGVKVMRKDSGKGWDILVEITNPLIPNSITTIPVQCKNFTNNVLTKKPIEDLERSIENYDASIAYLVIMGDLSDEFKEHIEISKEKMRKKLARDVNYEVINQDDFALLYLAAINRN